MRAIIQRVLKSKVLIQNRIKRKIGKGLLIFVGIENGDNEEDILWLSGKIIRLRIFNDEFGVMNKCILEIGGEIMIISQFTLHASTKKGNRPSYIKASKAEYAIPIYDKFVRQIIFDYEKKKVITGEFGMDMKIELINDGLVTIFIDTKNRE